MPEGSLYCPKCSQKNTDGRIPIFAFVKDIFQNLLDIDSRLFRTSFGLFVPGRLTNEFFKGRHKSFAMPSRLFLMSAILFFAIMSIFVNDKLEEQKISGDIFGIEAQSKTKAEIIAGMNQIEKDLQGEIPFELQLQLDSIVSKATSDTTENQTADIKLWAKTYHFDIEDFHNLTVDSMIQKYEIEDFKDKIIFKQAYKLREDPRTLISSLIGNLTWMMLLLIPSMALVFKLLYIRRKKYYVEHLVFLFHVHAFILLMGALMFILFYFIEIDIEEKELFMLLGILALYTIFALKEVYRQSWIKTFLKLFIMLISYMILFFLCMTFISVVSFLLF